MWKWIHHVSVGRGQGGRFWSIRVWIQTEWSVCAQYHRFEETIGSHLIGRCAANKRHCESISLIRIDTRWIWKKCDEWGLLQIRSKTRKLMQSRWFYTVLMEAWDTSTRAFCAVLPMPFQENDRSRVMEWTVLGHSLYARRFSERHKSLFRRSIWRRFFYSSLLIRRPFWDPGL